jgi:signal transduction histidine kinase/CheY-like chemotaxis protein
MSGPQPPPPDPAERDSEALARTRAELQRNVSLLLSTQQELIDLRDRRDREHKVLEGIVRFSERAGPAVDEPTFWERVVDSAVETFDCESCLAVSLAQGKLSVLAARGPRPSSEPECAALATLLTECSVWKTSLIEGDGLQAVRFHGGGVATVLFATVDGDPKGELRALVAAVTQRKKPFFPRFDALSVPGLRMFASHVNVLHEMLLSRKVIADQVAALDRSNAELEQRMIQQQRAAEEQDRLKGELAQARRMESIGRLAGGVAHDFNNMLMVICGNTELMQLDSSLGPHHQQSLAEVLAASHRAQALTQQLLMFSRKQVIRPTLLDLNLQIADSLKLYRRLIGEDIRLEFTPCTEPTPVLADRQQFDQLLGNLLLNARDAVHAAAHGNAREVHVSTHLVRGASPLPGGLDAIRLDVRDSGIGMDETTRQNIFEPFFTTKDIGKGTGLGLATVLGVIQQNHGRIEVQSVLGQGSTFSVYWPLASTATTENAAAEPLQRTRTSRGEHVLLVEDEDQVRNFMIKGLEHEGFTVTACPNADCALEKLAQAVVQPDVLVTDVVMPRINGGQLAEAVRQRYPGLPVLFVSGYTDDIIAQHGIVRDGVALLEKPFSPSALAHKVRELLDEHAKHP